MLIGVVHTSLRPPDPEGAVREARALEEAGADAVIVENFRDAPYPPSSPLEDVVAMAVVARDVARALSVPVGVNLLRNSCAEAELVAHHAGGRFIRCNAYTDVVLAESGVLWPQAHRLGRYPVKVLADIHVKHGLTLYPPTAAEAAEVAASRGRPAALVVTGRRTGEAPDPVQLAWARAAADLPVLVGSGICFHTLSLLEIADGAIVGTCLKEGGRVSRERAERLFREARARLRPRRALEL